MAIASGTRLGPYEVVAPIGAGGMGEVWRGRDTRLDRSVAIKVLPASFAANAQVKVRFEREARAISQLNHPNICTLYDVGDSYLVMELLEGESLSDRLAKGPLPLEQVLKIGTQIADALDKAHRHGIVHRDLKPGNVMLTKSGAKLLDFGLAKDQASGVGPEASGLTERKPLTEEGTILGTFQYMAPEQLEGTPADARTDIFALGAVLYEMATGKRAFAGKSKASLIANIMAAEPQPISTLQPATPAALDRLIRTCLQKDPDERWQSARDVGIELRGVSELTAGAPTARTRPSMVPWAVSAALAVALAAVVTRDAIQREPPPQVIRFDLAPPDNGSDIGSAVVSPDGKLLAIVQRRQGVGIGLALRRIDGTALREIESTEGASFAFWSPDSRSIGFFASGRLKKVSVDGSPPVTICETGNNAPRGGTWNRDGVILFASASGAIRRVPASGGNPVPVLSLDASTHEINQRYPSFLPDGKHFLYVSRSTDVDQQGLSVATLDGRARKRIPSVTSNAVFAPPDVLFYAQNGALRAQKFDLDQLELTGTPVTITDGVAYIESLNFLPVAVSTNGVLSFGTGLIANGELLSVDRKGKRIASWGEASLPAISPDGKRIACQRLDKELTSTDIWVLDTERGTWVRLTDDPRWDQDPVWSRDGRYVAWYRSGDVFKKDANGGGPEQRIGTLPPESEPWDWTPDGHFLVGQTFDPLRKADQLFILPVNPPAPFRKIMGSPFAERWPKVSPDGKWLTFASNESGRMEVYVQRFDPSGASQQKLQVSRDGGGLPHWSDDGKAIVWSEPAGSFFISEVTHAPELKTSPPRKLFDAQYRGVFDVAGDGHLVVAGPVEQWREPVHVIVNWPELLKEKAR